MQRKIRTLITLFFMLTLIEKTLTENIEKTVSKSNFVKMKEHIFSIIILIIIIYLYFTYYSSLNLDYLILGNK